MVTEPLSLTEALERHKQRLEAHYPGNRYESLFSVQHHADLYGGTWLMLSAYDRSVKVGRRVSRDGRDALQMVSRGPVMQLPDYPTQAEHKTLGDCKACSARWRKEHADVLA